jgi:hypothetical protein
MRIASLNKGYISAVLLSPIVIDKLPSLQLPTPLDPLCNDWTSLSVICFGVCELSIRQNLAATS